MSAGYLLDQPPREGLSAFLSDCAAVGADVALVEKVAIETVRYLRGTRTEREQAAAAQVLEQRWYASLEAGAPDFSVYAEDAYLGELWACWLVYSRAYLRSLRDQGPTVPRRTLVEDVGPARAVVDLGCGFGWTTGALKQLFPRAAVYGTNLEETAQMRLARLAEARFGFHLCTTVRGIAAPVDLVFASEYFEHVVDPITDLLAVLQLKPTALLIANAFGTRGLGHLSTYRVAGRPRSPEEVVQLFSAVLVEHGYRRVPTTFWNARPAYWRRAA